jgi:hypothetical protein
LKFEATAKLNRGKPKKQFQRHTTVKQENKNENEHREFSQLQRTVFVDIMLLLRKPHVDNEFDQSANHDFS